MTGGEKTEFFSKLTVKAGFYDEKAARNAYFGLLQMIFEGIRDSNHIELPNLGVFLIKKRKSRKALNVNTRQITVLPEKKEIKFIPNRNLREIFHIMKTKLDDIYQP